MKILQIILSAVLLLRIGGILLKKFDVNNEKLWFDNLLFKLISVVGIIISAYFTKGILSLILHNISMVHILINEVLNHKNDKKLKITYIISVLFFIILFTLTFL